MTPDRRRAPARGCSCAAGRSAASTARAAGCGSGSACGARGSGRRARSVARRRASPSCAPCRGRGSARRPSPGVGEARGRGSARGSTARPSRGGCRRRAPSYVRDGVDRVGRVRLVGGGQRERALALAPVGRLERLAGGRLPAASAWTVRCDPARRARGSRARPGVKPLPPSVDRLAPDLAADLVGRWVPRRSRA